MTYLQHLKNATGVPRDIARASRVVGGSAGVEMQRFLDRIKSGVPRDIPYTTATAVGAAVGAGAGMLKGHPFLGAVVGSSLGHNVPALLRPADRSIALVNMGETGFAVACSLAAKRHPFWGFLVGRLIAGAVTHYADLRK